MSHQSRRDLLKSFALGGGVVVVARGVPDTWLKPVVESVVLPAHAQTSACASSITATSLESDNPFPRIVVIVDSATEDVMASCEGGSVMASDLPPGEYWVLADSIAEAEHTVTISTECSSETLTYTTDNLTCTVLFATVSIPAGTITPGGGQILTGDWGCGGPDGCVG